MNVSSFRLILALPFVIGAPLSVSACVLVNDYGTFTIGDPDAGRSDAGAVSDAGTDSGADAGAPRDADPGRDAGADAGGDCSTPNTIYVAETGDDGNDGTLDAPLRSVAKAMAAVALDPTIVNVYVSAGTFEATYESANEIVLVDGVTLRGGYSDDFCTYDPATHVTTVSEDFTGGGAVDPSVSPIVAIRGDDLESGVVLEGFRISMGSETDDNHVGLRLRNTDAVIRDVVVTDGDGRVMTGVQIIGAASLTMERVTLAMDNASHTSTGLHLVDVGEASLSELIVERTVADGSLESNGIRAEYTTDGPEYALSISRSRIHGGRGGAGATGILISDTQPARNPVTVEIVNNLIHGGETGSQVYGIMLSGPTRDATIYNNTIFTGETDAFGHGIRYDYDFAGPDIRSNVIFSAGDQQFCIQQSGGAWTGESTAMSNNLFFDCPFFLFYDGTNEITDVAALNALANSTANQVAPSAPLVSLTGPDLLIGTMSNNDWGFVDGAPCTYTDGAFPAPEITVDYFGNARDGTPSIGAIEFTGTCTP